MIYKEELKCKLDAILKAFEDYIGNQSYFDIVWSKKIGYIWIAVDNPRSLDAEPLGTPEVMLDYIFNNVINDVIAPRETTSLTEAHTLKASEEAEVRRQLTAILGTIEDNAGEYLDFMDRYIQDYKDRCHGDGE